MVAEICESKNYKNSPKPLAISRKILSVSKKSNCRKIWLQSKRKIWRHLRHHRVQTGGVRGDAHRHAIERFRRQTLFAQLRRGDGDSGGGQISHNSEESVRWGNDEYNGSTAFVKAIKTAKPKSPDTLAELCGHMESSISERLLHILLRLKSLRPQRAYLCAQRSPLTSAYRAGRTSDQ